VSIKFYPVNGRVLVEKSKEDFNKTAGGLFIPKSSPGVDQHGEVGFVINFDGKDDHPLNEHLRPGVKIVFNHLAANEFKETPDGKPYYVMAKDSILLVYKE
jgi:co-chaperonin GroES (HSP10)